MEQTAQRFGRIRHLFKDALDRPPAERAAFLEAACAGDLALRDEVEALIRAHEQADAGGFLDTPFMTFPLSLTPMPSQAGRRIGPYALVRELGRGGMGVVYLARRNDVHKEVAVKLVGNAGATPETVRRFLRERRVLARLDHPHIARLLDAGMTEPVPGEPEGGLPYFVMEYVEGEPITAYCDRHRLGVVERLQMFEAVCEAVQYAHQNLVVHRDLKPSNILVDRTGTVKLLDFGIAKRIEDDEDEALTRTGLQLMTPEYAAPEQVRGLAVTTATDVYALGLLLYELLVGRRPYRLAGRTPTEIERIVCEKQPPRPSTLVRNPATADGDAATPPEAVGAVRGLPPERLYRRLRGDLDQICLKALEKEPARRYRSAGQMLDDLRRHREGRPIEARPGTVWYRTGRFVRRHRGSMAAVAGGFLLVAALVAVFTARLADERDRARREAAEAEQVTDLLLGVFDGADPFSDEPVRGDTVSARTLLHRGAARIDVDLVGQPDVQARLFDKIGRVYTELSLYVEAESLLTRALDQFRALPAPPDEEIAEVLNSLGTLYQKQGRYDEAVAYHREALALRRRLHGDRHRDVGQSLTHLGQSLEGQGAYEEAEPLMREAVEILRAVRGSDHADVASALDNLGGLLIARGDYAGAEPLLQEALAITRALNGDVHPNIATEVNNLGHLYYALGDYMRAESLLTEAVSINRRLLGEAHPYIALGLSNVANVQRMRGDYAASETHFREALALNRRLYPEPHPHRALIMNGLSRTLSEQGRYEEAEALLREALALSRALLGERHPNVAGILHNLAVVRRDRADPEEAARLFEQAVAQRREMLGSDHPYTRSSLLEYARLLAAQGDPAAAEPLYLEVLDALQAAAEAQREALDDLYAELADFYTAWDRPALADRYRTLPPEG